MSPARRTSLALAAATAAVLAAGVLAGCGSSSGGGQVSGSGGAATVEGSGGTSLADRAFSPEPKPKAAPAGSVANADGSTFSYRDAAQGKITLVYFGYTNCPDVCPTTMADIASALSKLPKDVADKVDVQLVSTDPRRDTDPQITQWLAGFDPSFQGGRAPIDQVVTQARAYGVGISPPTTVKGDYEVTHGAQVLALAPGGDEVGYFRELAGPEGYAAVLPSLVQKWA